MSVKPIPDGYHAVTPYLMVKDVAKEITFLEKAFDAKVMFRMDSPEGTRHAEVKIRDSVVMLGMAQGDCKPMPCMLYLYVEDADKVYSQALKAGATSIKKPQDMFYGDRSGAVQDDNGIQWWVATHVEEVTPDELSKRAAQQYATQGATN